MQWDDLRHFLALARAQTLPAAGQTLGVDGTTVWRRVDRLSKQLDTSLFEIGATGHKLTASGEELLRHAEDAERAVQAANSALTGERGRFTGTVRLSLSEGFASWIVAGDIVAFHAAHPGIRLEIATTNGFLNPSRREADLAVLLARPAKGPLVARKLTDYRLRLYAGRNYLAQHPPIQSPEDLRQHRLIGYIPDFIYADELRYLSEIASDLTPDFSSSSINAQYAMVRAGAGLAILPQFIGAQDPTLHPVLGEDASIKRSFWIVVHRDLSKVARVRAVIDWLTALVQERSALLV
jgi:DNA-binding transcriptional LysR family regulator